MISEEVDVVGINQCSVQIEEQNCLGRDDFSDNFSYAEYRILSSFV